MNKHADDRLDSELTWMNMKRKKVHRVNLKYCTYQNLKDMNKIHMKIIEIQETNSQVVQKYIKQLKIVCNTLWLQHDIN